MGSPVPWGVVSGSGYRAIYQPRLPLSCIAPYTPSEPPEKEETEGSPGRQWSSSPLVSVRPPSSTLWLVGHAFNFMLLLLIFSFFPNSLYSVPGVLDSDHHQLLLLSICSIRLLMLLFFCLLRCYCCYSSTSLRGRWVIVTHNQILVGDRGFLGFADS